MSLFQSSNSSSPSPPLSSCSSSSHLANSPHGLLTLRHLVPIKIDDRESCFVSGLSPSITKEETLRSAQFFGQFGAIKSIRFLLNSNPLQALIRFKSESAASRAISWCNEQTTAECPISAKHGYQKYCISFIKNKTCTKKDCPHRHRWCGPDDIITVKNQRFKVCDTPSDIFNSSKKKKKSLKFNKTEQQQQQVVAASSAERSQSNEVLIIQQQFSILQAQYSQQTDAIKLLLAQMKALQNENLALKQQLKQQQHQYGYQYAQPHQYIPVAYAQSAHQVPKTYVQQQRVPVAARQEYDDLNLVDDIVDSLFNDDFTVSSSSDSL